MSATVTLLVALLAVVVAVPAACLAMVIIYLRWAADGDPAGLTQQIQAGSHELRRLQAEFAEVHGGQRCPGRWFGCDECLPAARRYRDAQRRLRAEGPPGMGTVGRLAWVVVWVIYGSRWRGRS